MCLQDASAGTSNHHREQGEPFRASVRGDTHFRVRGSEVGANPVLGDAFVPICWEVGGVFIWTVLKCNT